MSLHTLRSFVAALAIAAVAAFPGTAAADPPPPPMVEFLNTFEEPFKQMSANPTFDLIGPLNGLWTAEKSGDNESLDIIHVTHIGPYVVEYIVTSPVTGVLSEPIGYAQQEGNGWAGWFSIACKGCCPGKSWWDEGVATIADKAFAVRVDTVKLDPESCELTTTPDVVDYRARLLNVVSFGEFLPGKLISIVAAPSVGNQGAQYQAAVKLVWDFKGYGVSSIDLLSNGPNGGTQVLAGSRDIAGETQYLTDTPGEHRFLLVAYNAAGHPLHFEIESIEIPNIPGIN